MFRADTALLAYIFRSPFIYCQRASDDHDDAYGMSILTLYSDASDETTAAI